MHTAGVWVARVGRDDHCLTHLSSRSHAQGETGRRPARPTVGRGPVKALVTGATGFVGAHVVRALAERGDDVRVSYRNPDRLEALRGINYARAKSDVLDYRRRGRAARALWTRAPMPLCAWVLSAEDDAQRPFAESAAAPTGG